MLISPVRQSGRFFLDREGRQVMLRGVNLGGDCKVPYPDGGTQFPSDFSDHREVSFIGRPFPLAEADEHLGRLAHWGFNCLRLLTTWEAVEHAGPGVYDEAYLDYFAEVCRRAGEHGHYVFVDFHEDVWSRMTGGDGAPGWTFEAVGLDFRKFPQAGAAHVMQAVYDYDSPEERQAAYPQMSWGSNHRLPANGIMWSLFWAGRVLTPDFRVQGENVQDFLQGRYLGAMEAVARRIAHLPNVLGFDTLNEPGTGWLGERLTYRHLGPSNENPLRARVGPALSALDALAVAAGVPTPATILARHPQTGIAEPAGERVINPNGVRIWLDGASDPFEAAGAWTLRGGQPTALNDDFFRIADVSEDGFGPLFQKVAETVRRHNPDWSIFAELDAFGAASGRPFPRDLPERTVNASHWYDAPTLYLKRFDAARQGGEAPEAIRARYIAQMQFRHEAGADFPGGAPTLIGEFGIPYDLDDGAAYAAWAAGEREGLWDDHALALDLMYDALDVLQLHSTQWNYTASNGNAARVGDGWNQEDLSIYSPDQREHPDDPDSGGRALEGFCRPFARRIQGRLTAVRFERSRRRLTLTYDADPTISGPTEIYVPRLQFPKGPVVRAEGLPMTLDLDPDGQMIRLTALAAGLVRVIVENGGLTR